MKRSFLEYMDLDEAGLQAERQENEFVEVVNHTVKINGDKPINVVSGDATVKGVIKAEKFSGRQASGSEPYTDVRLFTSKGIINLSMKGPSAPNLAGGGLRGVEAIIPGLGTRFYRAAYDQHMKNKLKLGDKIPDTYGKLNKKDKELLVIGNKAIGGPIDFMYIGPMKVNSKFNLKASNLFVSGKLIPAKKFSDTHELYFRLRARRGDQRFDPEAATPKGVPKIYGKSPSKGDSAGRLVVTDKVSGKGNNITF
jgi:hypothetical protein